MTKKYWFDLILIATFALSLGILLGAIRNSDEIEALENQVVELENQPSNQEYIEQIVDDFDLVIELQQYYYQEKITSHSFGDWLQINYPELYKRLESYF